VFEDSVTFTRTAKEARQRAGARILEPIDKVQVRPGQPPMSPEKVDRMIDEEVKAFRRERRNLRISCRENPGGATNELLHLLFPAPPNCTWSIEIINEAIEIPIERRRLQTRYNYFLERVGQYHADLLTLAHIVTIRRLCRAPFRVTSMMTKIVACAVAAGTDYIATRDHGLLTLGNYGTTKMITPEEFLGIVRAQQNR
jgi:predicted nucleic acid-binding protein